ncbi:MAG: hypothetical protein Q8K30_00845 [Candidatus Gracilibacteria bacterium]|nr:hypothetical protein [Candidatus Gracilibacteria bacterium]
MNIKHRYETLSHVNFKPDEIIIPDNFQGLKNLQEFNINYRNKRGKLRPQYVRVYNFLSRIQEQISEGKDPIEYLYYLYYEIKISTIDIENELGYLGNYSQGVIGKMMKKVLGWELRGTESQNHKTPLRKEKDQIKIKDINKEQNRIKLENVTKVENILSRIAKNKEKKVYSSKIYNSLKNIRTRAKYLLDINGYINEEVFVENLIKISDKYGMKVTAKAITNILEKETNKIGNIDKLEMRAGRIREIKNEQDL